MPPWLTFLLPMLGGFRGKWNWCSTPFNVFFLYSCMFLDYKEKKIIKIRQELFELQNFEVCFLTNFRYRSLLRIYKDQMAPFWVKSASKRQFLCFIVVKSIWNALKPYIFWNVEVSQILSKSQNSIIFLKFNMADKMAADFTSFVKQISTK